LIWAMVNGEWPDGEIDHINGDRSDNRISNLRVVTHRENAMNRSRRSDNASGVTGVHKCGSKWRATIKTSDGYKCLGLHSTIEDAARVRYLAERAHGYHANHGRITP